MKTALEDFERDFGPVPATTIRMCVDGYLPILRRKLAEAKSNTCPECKPSPAPSGHALTRVLVAVAVVGSLPITWVLVRAGLALGKW